MTFFMDKADGAISTLSFALTYSVLLSTIRQADGFETTDCLECLQILDILNMAGGSAVKLEIGHCALY